MKTQGTTSDMSATISTKLPSPPITQAQEVIKAAEAQATRPTLQGATTSAPAPAPVPMATTAAATLTEVPTREVATEVLSLSMATAAMAVGMEEVSNASDRAMATRTEAMALVTDQDPEAVMESAKAQLSGE